MKKLFTSQNHILVPLWIFCLFLSPSWHKLSATSLFNLSINSTAQRTITGTVTNDNLEQLAGVNVYVKDYSIGTFTDKQGFFSLDIPDEATTLIFSYIGYKTVEQVINNQDTLSVVMVADLVIDEVVVLGYGYVAKSDLTGAVSSVDKEQLAAYPSLNPIQALQGRAAGLQIQSNNGEPGSDYKIRIRGATSINAGSDPIFVVDGFVGAALPPAADIESVEILKDASATAIYGSRGSNGVLIINTKKGESGKTRLEFNTSFSTQTVINKLDLLDGSQFATYRKEIDPNYVSPGANTDWQDEIFRTGGIQDYQLSLSGGSESVQYYLSGNYFDQKGLIIGSNYQRYSLNSAINIAAGQRFDVGLNLFAQRNEKDGTLTQEFSGGIASTGVVAAAFKFEPDQSIYNDDGTFTIAKINDPHDNPYAIATQRVEEQINDLLQANVFVKVDLLKGLSFNSTFGGSINNGRRGVFLPTTLNIGSSIGGEATVGGTKNTLLLNENYLTYSTTINQDNALSIMGGYSYQKTNLEAWSGRGQSFLTDAVNFWDLDGAASFQRATSDLAESRLASGYGRLQYSFDRKYLVTLNARYDGSSTFSKNHKWAFFPSGALAWNIAEEKFMDNMSWMNRFKLRTSFGQTGNQAIEPYQTLASFVPVFTVINGTPVNAVAPSFVANNELTWETTTQLNVGTDLGIFDDRISLTFDYYKMRTRDLLFEVPLPEYSGYKFQLKNIGEVENKGVEFSIQSRNLSGEFKWTTDFNISRNRNKVVKLEDGNDIVYDASPGHMVGLDETHVLQEGMPVGVFYGWIYDGVYQADDAFIPGSGFEQEAGGEKYQDLDNSGELDTDDRTIIGDPNPDFTWALNNDFQWKGFDLNIFFQGSQGNDILSYTLMELDLMAGLNNATTAALDRWSPSNTDTDIPKTASRSRNVSTRWVFDGSYTRLKNIALGYTFSQLFSERKNSHKVRIYLSAQNLLTFTKYKGYDPEVNYRSTGNVDGNRNLGLDYGSYPNAKSFTVGLNLVF